jgi:peptidoglycan/LPS O-acetylase OafA/YrhL
VASQFLHFSNYWIATHGWNGVAPGTGVYWSLAVEEHFYFVFPAVFIALSRRQFTRKQMAVVFWATCAVVLAWRCVLVLVLHSAADRTYVCSDTRVDSIAFGCALALGNNPILDELPPRLRSSTLWGAVLLPLGLLLLLVTFVVRDGVFRETVRYTLQGIGLTPIFVTSIRWPGWPPFRFLNWRPVRFVGTLSYSLYLVHQAILVALEQHTGLPGLARGVAALGIALVASYAIYRYVEKPAARLRRRFSTAD